MSNASQAAILYRLEQAVEELHSVVVEMRAQIEQPEEAAHGD